MIRTLRLENYRGFEEYELRDLAAVNLLVGPNNCGKTSVLEAVDLLASGGDPGVLVKSARRRSEFALGEPDPGYDRRRYPRYPVHHQFHGHRIWPGSRLTISSGDGMGRVTIHVEQVRSEQADVFDRTAEDGGPLRLRIERDASESDIELPLDADGLITGRWTQATIRERLPHSPSVPIHFITAESLHAREMARVWDQVLVEGREPEVVDAMRILQDDLRSIHFLTGSASGGSAGGIVLGFKPGRPRTPIGSYGDGMRRMPPPEIEDAGGAVRLTFRASGIRPRFRGFVAEETRRRIVLGTDQLLVLRHLVQHGEIDAPTASRLCQRREQTAAAVLAGMESEFGYLAQRGNGPGMYWTLSPEVHARLVSADDFHRESMTIVKADGTVTHRDPDAA